MDVHPQKEEKKRPLQTNPKINSPSMVGDETALKAIRESLPHKIININTSSLHEML